MASLRISRAEVNGRSHSLLAGIVLFAIFSLSILATACQTESGLFSATVAPLEPGVPRPTVTPAPAESQASSAGAEPTPIPIGLSRANPLPFMETASLPDWEVSALEIRRGEAAWQIIQAVNQFNEPAGDGWEYLLLKLRAGNTSAADENYRLALTVTGDRHATHYSFDAGVVVPEPRLETVLPGGAEMAGWLAYRIPFGEGNLMLAIKDGHDYGEPARYLALEEGAAVETETAVLTAIIPTETGTDPANPAPFGRTTVSEYWQLTLLDVVRGEAAWQAVYEANQFNDPPPAGMEYVLIRTRLRYIGLQEDGVFLSDRVFTLTDGSGTAYERPVVVEPEPDLMAHLFPGGEAEGVIVRLAEAQRKNLTLVFESPFYNAAEDTRYLSLGEYGR